MANVHMQIRSSEIREALGLGGQRVVMAADSKLAWCRITRVKVQRGLTYGLALDSGKWFVIHDWEERR
jgi:hypothetical protein